MTCTHQGRQDKVDILPSGTVPRHLRFIYPFLNSDNDSGAEKMYGTCGIALHVLPFYKVQAALEGCEGAALKSMNSGRQLCKWLFS